VKADMIDKIGFISSKKKWIVNKLYTPNQPEKCKTAKNIGYKCETQHKVIDEMSEWLSDSLFLPLT
jgi:hypothetical protein